MKGSLFRHAPLLVLVVLCLGLLPYAAVQRNGIDHRLHVPIVHAQPPGRPMLISGAVSLNGSPVPDGISVIAKVGSEVRGTTTTSASRYDLMVNGTNGETISFYLNSLAGNQTAVFDNVSGGGILQMDLSFTDSTPPTSPRNIRVIQTLEWNKPTLAWDPAIDDVAVQSYVVMINGASQNVGNVTQWTAGPLIEGNYTVSVLAVDVAGNQGPQGLIQMTVVIPEFPTVGLALLAAIALTLLIVGRKVRKPY